MALLWKHSPLQPEVCVCVFFFLLQLTFFSTSLCLIIFWRKKKKTVQSTKIEFIFLEWSKVRGDTWSNWLSYLNFFVDFPFIVADGKHKICARSMQIRDFMDTLSGLLWLTNSFSCCSSERSAKVFFISFHLEWIDGDPQLSRKL